METYFDLVTYKSSDYFYLSFIETRNAREQREMEKSDKKCILFVMEESLGNVVRNISASIGEDKSSIIAGDKLQFSDLSVYLDWSAFPLRDVSPSAHPLHGNLSTIT